MFVQLMGFQKSYLLAASNGVPKEEEFRTVHSLLNPGDEIIDKEGYEKFYRRFITVKHDENTIQPTDNVYKKNFKTLWANALLLNSKLEELNKEFDLKFQNIKQNICEYEKNSSEYIYETVEKVKECGKYVRGNESITAYRPYKDIRVVTHFSASMNKRFLVEEEERLKKEEEILSKFQGHLLIEQIESFVKQAVQDGSFLWIHDLITLVDTDDFYTGTDRENGLRGIRDELKCKHLIENNLGDIQLVKEGFKELQLLEEYVCEALNKKELRWGTGGSCSENKAEYEVFQLLDNCLAYELENQELIQFILKLDMFDKEDCTKLVMRALRHHVNLESTEKADQVLEMNLIDLESLKGSFYRWFDDALENEKLDEAKYILKINGDESPMENSSLGILFAKKAFGRNVEILRFIQELAGEIPENYMKRAIQNAKLTNDEHVLEYLKPHMSTCTIF